MGFAAEQLTRVRVAWQEMLDHPFLLRTRDGAIAFETFATWMRQDYLFVEAAIPFISILLAKAPEKHQPALSDVLGMLHKELGLFRERAAAVGVDLGNLEPSFVNHAYIQFLLATAYRESYACGYTVLYAAERAYHDSWRVVLNGIDPGVTLVPVRGELGGRRVRRVRRLPRRGARRARRAGGHRGAGAHGGAVRAHDALRDCVLEHGVDRRGVAARERVRAGGVTPALTSTGSSATSSRGPLPPRAMAGGASRYLSARMLVATPPRGSPFVSLTSVAVRLRPSHDSEEGMRWASAVSRQQRAADAFGEAAKALERQLDGSAPDLLLAFASPDYASECEHIVDLAAQRFPHALLVGCTAGGVIGDAHEVEGGLRSR